ncbi:hypothetical protein [Planktothrix sp.]|uniref:hypothetical protein n=2 Tax=Planktothrix sp. TaxID=3088171 RepID=UPI0038D3B83F
MLSYQYRMDETTAPTEAQMKLAIAQTLSLPFAYNAPVVVLNFEVDEDGGITGNFKDAARPRVFSFELDGESVSYSPFKPGKMDSLDSEDGVIEWEEFSAGYSYRVDAGIGTGKKPQCVKPTAYNCGSACINVNKNCKSNAKDNVSKDRLKKLKGLAMSYYKEFEKLDKTERGSDKQKEFGDKSNQASRKRLALMEQAKGKKGVKSEESQAKPKAESKKPSGQKSTAKKTTEPKVKVEAKSSPKSKANPFYSDEPIKDYDTFKKEISKELARINFENNYDGLIPIPKMREELKGRVKAEDFDKWMLRSQADNDNIQLGEGQKQMPGGIKTELGAHRDYIRFFDKEAMEKARTETKRKPGQITDPKEFEDVAMKSLADLDKDGKYGNLIPIHELRKSLGDKVSRGDFNNLLMEMQANDKVQLIGGEMTDSTPKKVEDSITTSLGGVRYYVKILKD